MEDVIQIKCPFDGAVLTVRNQPGIETMNVTCPICKHRYPFTQFKRVIPVASGEDPDTVYPEAARRNPGDREECTRIDLPSNLAFGKVSMTGSDFSFRLKPGRNVIGRKSRNSQANFQIDTGDDRSMSREHILINVQKVPGKGLVHYLSLYKEKVNKTFIGDEQLCHGDCIVLNHGDIIRLPGATLKFEIPDDEETVFD